MENRQLAVAAVPPLPLEPATNDAAPAGPSFIARYRRVIILGVLALAMVVGGS
jgi:hypothetical protein